MPVPMRNLDIQIGVGKFASFEIWEVEGRLRGIEGGMEQSKEEEK